RTDRAGFVTMNRVHILTAGIALLAIAGLTLLLTWPDRREAEIREYLETASSAFRSEHSDFPARFLGREVSVTLNGMEQTMSRQEVEARRLTLIDGMGRMEIEPRKVSIRFPDEDTADVTMEVSWRVSGRNAPASYRQFGRSNGTENVVLRLSQAD